jgi:hypothetical protein
MLASVLLSLLLPAQISSAEVKEFSSVLALSARGELHLVERMGHLRKAAEKLPANWKATSIDKQRTMTKQDFLNEIAALETLAAERWAIIVENTALIDFKAERLDARQAAMRQELQRLPNLHLELNQNLDQLNQRLKEGIMVNLTSRLTN